jgi:hypothetical protein
MGVHRPWRSTIAARTRKTILAVSEDHLLAHTSPLGWSHIGLTGDYLWEQAAIASTVSVRSISREAA